MECPHAYMKQHIDYVLCKKEPEPSRHDREKLFHAVCAHQVHCPKENCHKLSAGWQNCMKLREASQSVTDEVSASEVQTPAEETKKPARSRRKPKTDE